MFMKYHISYMPVNIKIYPDKASVILLTKENFVLIMLIFSFFTDYSSSTLQLGKGKTGSKSHLGGSEKDISNIDR